MGKLTFHILGDLEVAGRHGTVRVGGQRRRGLLAYLLTHIGRRVSLDAICDAVWDSGSIPTRPATGWDSIDPNSMPRRSRTGSTKRCARSTPNPV